MGDIKYYGKRRSIVRRIGSFLPLKPPPKIYVSVTPLHSMTSSMINEDASDFADTNGYGPARLSGSRPDLLEPISFGSEVRLLALEQELQELREQISTIVKNNKLSKHASVASLPNGADEGNSLLIQPPPPPPLPPPTTPHIARRASLQDHKTEDRKKASSSRIDTQKSTGDMIKDIDNVKLRPIARSPGGHPIRVKRENSPCNDLQEILRRRYVAMAMDSPDSRNSSINLAMDDSF